MSQITNAKEGAVLNLDEHGYDGFDLMDGERVVRSIGAEGGDGTASAGKGTLLLTDSRVIRVSVRGSRTEVAMASVEEIGQVEITTTSEKGIGAFLWAGLAIVLSVILFFAIENVVGKLAAPAATLAMGGYLVANRMFYTRATATVFRIGETSVEWPSQSDEEIREALDFVSALYEVKYARRSEARRPFAPR